MEKYLLFIIGIELAWIIGLLVRIELWTKIKVPKQAKPLREHKTKPPEPTAEEIKYKTILDNIDNYGTSKPQQRVR